MCLIFDVHIYWKMEAGKHRVRWKSIKAPKEKNHGTTVTSGRLSPIATFAHLLGGLSVSFVKPVCQCHSKYNSIYVGERGGPPNSVPCIYIYVTFFILQVPVWKMALIYGFHWGGISNL